MLEVKNISVGYDGKPVLQQVTLAVRGGEVLAVVGPNGAGKSTLVRAVSGVLPLQHGCILVGGTEITRLNYLQRARLLAVVPQARLIPAAFNVYQTILMGRTPYLKWLGRPSHNDHQAVQKALELTCIEGLASRPIGELSGGEQQRVLLARALAQDTPVLLLDEPTTHLDLQHQSGILNLVRELASVTGRAVLMVLHDLNLAGLYSDRVALLAQGRLLAIGSPQQVFTSENLSGVYHVPVEVIPHPGYDTPLVLPNGHKAAKGYQNELFPGMEEADQNDHTPVKKP